MPKALLTGFDPFGGEPINPSYEAVSQLDRRTIDGVQIVAWKIPTVFRRSVDVLAHAIETVQPQVVICVGQAGGASDIRVERVALNLIDARIPDNEGNQPVDVPVVPDGPVAYWSTLPVKAIVHNLRAAGIPASVSYSAGTFVCNQLFYGLAHLLATQYPSVRGGFLHIPYLPEQAARHPGAPSMALETVVKALEIAVRTCFQQELEEPEAERRISEGREW
jgi:pyroglutamyl-peptidase I